MKLKLIFAAPPPTVLRTVPFCCHPSDGSYITQWSVSWIVMLEGMSTMLVHKVWDMLVGPALKSDSESGVRNRKA